MRNLTKIFKALSDSNRIRILKMLEERPLCVCEITELLQLANSTVSKHLSMLRDVNLILDEKDGKWVNYRLNLEISEPYIHDLIPLIQKWLVDDNVVIKDREKVIAVDRFAVCKT